MAHACLFLASAFWGLMAPLGKDAMTHGLNGLDMVAFRVLGGCILFWITSFFVKKERVSRRDLLMFAGAAVFGLVTNQCCFTVGLSITSPINASIVTTSMPIFAMILAFLILKEPITGKKAGGVALGCVGAIMLIVTSAVAANSRVGNIWGDLMCMGAQLSFALYLSLFSPLIRHYSVFTVNKWMFTYATLMVMPISWGSLSEIEWAQVPATTWWETAFVVVFCTYIGYIFMMIGQQVLRPTVVSVYNYVQPIVSVTVSILAGLCILKPTQVLAVVLVFSGVWLVTKSRSLKDSKNKEK